MSIFCVYLFPSMLLKLQANLCFFKMVLHRELKSQCATLISTFSVFLVKTGQLCKVHKYSKNRELIQPSGSSVLIHRKFSILKLTPSCGEAVGLFLDRGRVGFTCTHEADNSGIEKGDTYCDVLNMFIHNTVIIDIQSQNHFKMFQ